MGRDAFTMRTCAGTMAVTCRPILKQPRCLPKPAAKVPWSGPSHSHAAPRSCPLPSLRQRLPAAPPTRPGLASKLEHCPRISIAALRTPSTRSAVLVACRAGHALRPIHAVQCPCHIPRAPCIHGPHGMSVPPDAPNHSGAFVATCLARGCFGGPLGLRCNATVRSLTV